MKIINKIRKSKDWKEFRYLWKKDDEGNPFIFIYTLGLSLLTVLILTILPAFFFLFFLFLPKALLSGMETSLLSNMILGLVLPLAIPQWFYIFGVIHEENIKTAEGHR